jgi:tetratricopeptide (TPR) repeat protein
VDEPEGGAVTRLRLLLVGVIAAELAAGAYLWFRRPKPPDTPAAPVPDLSGIDPLVAAKIREQAADCRTPEQWAGLGETYLAVGYFAEGEACYRYAKEKKPNDPDRAFQWAFAVERLGRLPEANAGYERAVELGYRPAGDAWYFIGRNHLRMRDTEAARAAFEKAGNQPSARYELARLLDRAGNPEAAIPVLDRLAARYPTAVQPPLLRHRIEALRDGPKAVVYADRADRFLTRLPTPFDDEFNRLEGAYQRLGQAAEWREARESLEAGDLVAAEKRTRDALAAGWAPELADLLADIESRKGRPAEAARLLQEVIDRAGPTAPILDGLGDALLAAGRPDQAVRAWARATDLGIGATAKGPYHKLAEHYRKAGDAAAADWHDALAYFAAGHELFWAGRYAEAKQPFEEAVKYDPRLAAGWCYLGEVHRLGGRPDDARKAYRRCLDLDPNFGRARTGLALLDLGPG